MKSAPNSAPEIVASPPTTIAARKANEIASVKASGATKAIANT